MGQNRRSTLTREMYVVCHFPYPYPVSMPFEQTAFEKSLFRTGGGGPVQFGAKQCMYTPHDTRPLRINSV
jgi:hypothetical protein